MPKKLEWTSCENDSVSCHDGLDNDLDGAKDCADPDCAQEDCRVSVSQLDASTPPSISSGDSMKEE